MAAQAKVDKAELSSVQDKLAMLEALMQQIAAGGGGDSDGAGAAAMMAMNQQVTDNLAELRASIEQANAALVAKSTKDELEQLREELMDSVRASAANAEAIAAADAERAAADRKMRAAAAVSDNSGIACSSWPIMPPSPPKTLTLRTAPAHVAFLFATRPGGSATNRWRERVCREPR